MRRKKLKSWFMMPSLTGNTETTHVYLSSLPLCIKDIGPHCAMLMLITITPSNCGLY